MRTGQAAAIVLMVLLAGCSSGGTSDVASGSSPSPSPSPSPTATSPSPPAAIDYAGAKLVTGREVFSINRGTVTYGANGTGHDRGGTLHSTITCADPRVAGTAVGTWNSDHWGPNADNAALVQWGKYRITNAGGSWVGGLTGVYTSATSDVITWWLTGTGTYAGLSMYMWETPGLSPGEQEGYPFTALIFPGKPPTP